MAMAAPFSFIGIPQGIAHQHSETMKAELENSVIPRIPPEASSYRANFSAIERSLQGDWHATGQGKANVDAVDGPKRYVLGMFPYPSGNAHMGHILVYALSDALARLGRYMGEEVLNPLGWDAFGLPAENAAIKHNVDPRSWTERNIARMRDEQIGRAGYSFDYDREIDTSSESFYRWTQWLFSQLYRHGHIYRGFGWVNWDPVDRTVLANEQVIDGRGWRSGAPIERRQMEQWNIRITAFAEDLWRGLDGLTGWSDRAIGAQRSWIGRSEGADIKFVVNGGGPPVTIFTTRADTIFGVTSVTLAPDHPRVLEYVQPQAAGAVGAYIQAALAKSEIERQAGAADGVFTGTYAIHPITQRSIPIYISGYVLGGYGSGAIMNVPAHDRRDYDFAQAKGLPIEAVIRSEGGDEEVAPYEGPGRLERSGRFSGMASEEARRAIIADLESQGIGASVLRYRLRDWTVSRQRAWGCPIPMMADLEGNWRLVPDADLPVRVAGGADPADGLVAGGINGECTLESDTLDTFMCSAWYAWRFLAPQASDKAWSAEVAARWMPIDFYVGGIEHANQHLIYFRYISHFLHSIGLTPTREPVLNFLDNGMVRLGGRKMSKSLGNTIDPSTVINAYGADALRLSLLADTPFERDREWNDSLVKSKHAFLSEVWTLAFKLSAITPKKIVSEPPTTQDAEDLSLIAAVLSATDNVRRDLDERRAFHVAVSRLHSTLNLIAAASRRDPTANPVAMAFAIQAFLKMLSLFAPHISDHLWRIATGAAHSIFRERWPVYDLDLVNRATSSATVVVQIDGRRRGAISVPKESTDDEVEELVRRADDQNITLHLSGGVARRVVVRDQGGVPKLVNLVLEPA